MYRCNKKDNDSKRNKRTTIYAMHFFHVSDTHLDLYYNKTISNKNSLGKEQMCRNIQRIGGKADISRADNIALFARVGCDSSELLVQSAADEMKRINYEDSKQAEFVLLTGESFISGDTF